MSLPTQALSALQAAGAAVYAADLELKQSVQIFADQVKEAMQQNPFDLGNDSLFEDWKTVARLSQAIGQIETELRKIYSAAGDLSLGSPAVLSMAPTLEVAAPTMQSPQTLKVVNEIQATDAVIKKSPHALPGSASKAHPAPLRGNAAKVLAQLKSTLSTKAFAKINKSAVAQASAVPQGSVGAAISRLVAAGYLHAGDGGTFKLAAHR